MHAAGELAQLGDREPQLVDSVGEHLVQLGVEVATEALLCGPKLEGERDEPLLGAVVDVALDPATLVVAGGDDARPGLLTWTSWARSSAWRRAFSSASRAAAPAASRSRGSSRRLGSWTRAASGFPSLSRTVTARREPGAGSVIGLPYASAYALRSGSQNASSRLGSSRARASASRSFSGGTLSRSRIRSATCAAARRE